MPWQSNSWLTKREKARAQETTCGCFLLGLGACCLLFGGLTLALHQSVETVTVTVQEKERVATSDTSYYLVWTDGEVFAVEDSTVFWTFDASDRYGRLRVGETYRVRVAGWRVPVLSWYRNIVEVY